MAPCWTSIHFWDDQNGTGDIHFGHVFDASVFWYLFTSYHTHLIRFRYDFLSSITIWYTFECIKVYLMHFWVHQNYQKWIKIRCPNFDRFKSVSKFSQGTFTTLGCDHIGVYGIRYTLYDLLSAIDDIQVVQCGSTGISSVVESKSYCV